MKQKRPRKRFKEINHARRSKQINLLDSVSTLRKHKLKFRDNNDKGEQ